MPLHVFDKSRSGGEGVDLLTGKFHGLLGRWNEHNEIMPGISDAFAYWGMPLSVFCWHGEDWEFCTLNMLLLGRGDPVAQKCGILCHPVNGKNSSKSSERRKINTMPTDVEGVPNLAETDYHGEIVSRIRNS